MRAREYAARLFLHWYNQRYRRGYAPEDAGPGLWRATYADRRPLLISAAELFEEDDAWRRRASELEQRLDDTRPGSYLLWVPPGGRLPAEEPEESEWVRRVVLGASKLASGRSGEVRLPVRLMIGKVRDEGGYASVTGGLGRYWTEISGRLQGSYYLDSRGLNRFTRNQEERVELYDNIGMVAQSLKSGDAMEFEHEDAWSVQRLARGDAAAGMTDGWAITGCPPGFDPADGGAIRRLLRRRLAEAREALSDAGGAARVLVLIGAYDYMESENAGPSLRGFDPSLAAAFDAIALVADTEVKALTLARALTEAQ
jgi:hypothetical protein